MCLSTLGLILVIWLILEALEDRKPAPPDPPPADFVRRMKESDRKMGWRE